MKHNIFWLLSVVLLLTSCSQVYNYVQVFNATSQSDKIKATDAGMIYEDANCSILYNFWAEGGDAGFIIHNKTNVILYIDLTKSFIIKNDIAYDYYLARSMENSSTHTAQSLSAYSGFYSVHSYGSANTTLASTAVEEKPIVAIPPKASKRISEYGIMQALILDCDLDRYPSEKASMEFDETNSPLHFTNYITYKLGETEQENVITNNFYISKVTNFAEPYAYKYIERNKPCQNLTSDESSDYKSTYPVKVYDRYYTFDVSNSFYLNYNISSKRKLYKGTKKYYYDAVYNGYTENGSSEQSNYQQLLLNPFVKPQ